MVWTHERILTIPEEYRDFMLTLKPILDSRRPGAILRTTAIPFGKIVGLLLSKYDYSSDEIQVLANRLRQQGLVNEDSMGFYQPTGEGEVLIKAIIEQEQNDAADRVPPFPNFAE